MGSFSLADVIMRTPRTHTCWPKFKRMEQIRGVICLVLNSPRDYFLKSKKGNRHHHEFEPIFVLERTEKSLCYKLFPRFK